jgi:5-deoxy-glucuronate isomerase
MEGVAERERPVILTSNGEPDRDGLHVGVPPHFAGWYYVGFEVLRLGEGRTVERRIEDAEVCLVILSGRCTVSTGDVGWQGIGGRESIFDGAPYAVYLPPGVGYEIESVTDVEVAIASAPAERGVTPYLVRPDDVEVEVRGSETAERRIQLILMEDRPEVRPLAVGVLSSNDHWSSYPPPKHDQNYPPLRTVPRGGLLSQAQPGAGLRIAEGLHQGRYARRDPDLPQRRRGAGAEGLPNRLRAAGIRPVLPTLWPGRCASGESVTTRPRVAARVAAEGRRE